MSSRKDPAGPCYATTEAQRQLIIGRDKIILIFTDGEAEDYKLHGDEVLRGESSPPLEAARRVSGASTSCCFVPYGDAQSILKEIGSRRYKVGCLGGRRGNWREV
ncbi:hypothetical protein AMTR_s00019p00238710 [Amborella trichopoda]|uniref:Uncharacterized protein n=1 Tax=Amborella trichopoda TaxID=13333 RepID=W1PIB8_AMBTC|nr:hypothetical protein AMTR_s00019p00238710 [Amborella trichopoda]